MALLSVDTSLVFLLDADPGVANCPDSYPEAVGPRVLSVCQALFHITSQLSQAEVIQAGHVIGSITWHFPGQCKHWGLHFEGSVVSPLSLTCGSSGKKITRCFSENTDCFWWGRRLHQEKRSLTTAEKFQLHWMSDKYLPFFCNSSLMMTSETHDALQWLPTFLL